MGKFIRMFMVTAICAVGILAQDVIYLCNGSEINAKVLRSLNMGNVEYVSSNGENSLISVAEVAMIKYSTGHLVNYVLAGRSDNRCSNAAAQQAARGQAAQYKAEAEQSAREQSAQNKAAAELAYQDNTSTEQEQIEEPAPTIGFLGVLGVGIAGLGSAMMEGGLRAGEGYSGADKFKKIDWKAFGFGSGVAAGGLALALIADFIPFIKHRVKERRAKIAAEHVQLGVTLDGNYYAGVRFDF